MFGYCHAPVSRTASTRAREARPDVIVVLGCRIYASGRPSAPARRRAAAAVKAFHEGMAPLVLVSGGRRWGAQIEASSLREEIVRGGVPASAIIEELWSLTTVENAIYTAAILRRIGASRAALVTCSWHMQRALSNFRGAGVEVVAAVPAAPDRSGFFRRAWRSGHEIVCERLDERAMKRARVIRESADPFARRPGGPS